MARVSYSVGDTVVFRSNTDTPVEGTVVAVLQEHQPPHILLIEHARARWMRSFRLESEVEHAVPVGAER